MNREQFGAVALAAIAVVVLSLAATTLTGLEDDSSTDVAGSGVFSEDVTLENEPDPSDRDLSGVPFLERLYETTVAGGDANNTAEETVENRGRVSLVPIALLFGGLVAVGVVALLVWLWRLRARSEYDGAALGARTDDDRERETGSDRASTGRSDPEVTENDVYRTWYELVTLVDSTGRESDTPRETARLALDEGMRRDAVETITDQFEAVRYGGATATTERERRAREALSRLERTGDSA